MLEELSGIIEAQSVEILLEALAHLLLEACGKVIWRISCDCGYRRKRRILAEMPENIYHGSRYARGSRRALLFVLKAFVKQRIE